MSVVDIGHKQKESPMLARIDDPQLRERCLAAQSWAASKYNALGSWRKFVRLVGGHSESAFSAFLNGSYPGSPAHIIASIERARELEEERAASVFSPQFVDTSIAKRIRRVVKQTRVRGALGICSGESGVGKGSAFAQISATDPSVVYIRANPTFRLRLWPVLVFMMNALGQGTAKRSSPAICYDVLKETLLASRKMLLLDEAQFYSREALDALRSLSEDAETPILFSGNDELYECGFFAGAKPAAFTQFQSRCLAIEHIRRTDITRRDVELIAAQLLEDEVLEETLDALVVEAHMPGAFRRLRSTLQRAHEKAKGGKVATAQVFDSIGEATKKRGAA